MNDYSGFYNLDKSELKKLFSESDLLTINKFLDYVQTKQSNFSDDSSIGETDTDIQLQVKDYIRRRKANGQIYTRREN